jgi:hypothetical protein
MAAFMARRISATPSSVTAPTQPTMALSQLWFAGGMEQQQQRGRQGSRGVQGMRGHSAGLTVAYEQ